MRNNIFLVTLTVVMIFCCLLFFNGSKKNESSYWKLEWIEEFNSKHLNLEDWEYMQRGRDQSRKYHSSNPNCYDFKKGKIIIRAIQNPNLNADTATYLTGAITTKGKKRFSPPCRIEVKAKINSATGAWPAIWLLPFDRENMVGLMMEKST